MRGNRPARPMAASNRNPKRISPSHNCATRIVEVRGSGGQQRSCSHLSYWVSQVSYWYDGRVRLRPRTRTRVQSPSPQAPCSKRARAVARWPRPLPRLRVLLHRCKIRILCQRARRGQTIPCSRARSRPLRRYPLNRSQSLLRRDPPRRTERIYRQRCQTGSAKPSMERVASTPTAVPGVGAVTGEKFEPAFRLCLARACCHRDSN